MKDINIVTIVGRLTATPEIKHTQNGTIIGKFSIANNESVKVNGQWTEHTNYFNVVVFGKNAENCCKYLEKGSQVVISGNIKQQRWKDQQGQNKSTVEITAQQVQFVGTQKKENKQNYDSDPFGIGQNDPWEQGQKQEMPF